MAAFYPEALAGFIMVVTEEGDMTFLTENVNKHIGISQVGLQLRTGETWTRSFPGSGLSEQSSRFVTGVSGISL